MPTIDEIYNQEHLVTVDPYQFNAVIFALARGKLGAFVNDTSKESLEPCLHFVTDGRYLMVWPAYPDRRFYAPKVDHELWAEFERVDPEGAKSQF